MTGSRDLKMRWLLGTLCVWLICAAGIARGAENVDAGSSHDCHTCHRERDAALVAGWEKSRHNSPDVDCRSCHGTRHDGTMAAHSRRNETCTGCHSRENNSYIISKHGVIATLEAGRMDFSQPLRDGNFRTPTCAYCHMHAGNHDTGAGMLPLMPATNQATADSASRSEARAAPCRDCHSPRFVETWFSSGDRMVEIGRMKVREAMDAVSRLDGQDADSAQKTRTIQQRMVNDHLGNVRLGVGHQSPDDQWWHGHPALDGDLLRIKSFLSDSLRKN